MDTAQLITNYGYLAIALGTFFEGEMIMLAAGAAAGAGWVNLPLAIVAGMGGIFASDTVCFLIGRLAGSHLQRWFPRSYSRLGLVFKLIERHDEKLLVFFQFFPGLCTVTPLAFGLTRISIGRFMLLDLLGNATWTLVFTLGGFCFGSALNGWISGLHPWASAAAVLVGVAGVVCGFRQLRRSGKKFFAATESGTE